jgi:hypothetical protein
MITLGLHLAFACSAQICKPAWERAEQAALASSSPKCLGKGPVLDIVCAHFPQSQDGRAVAAATVKAAA